MTADAEQLGVMLLIRSDVAQSSAAAELNL